MNRLLTLAVPVLLLASCVAKMEEDHNLDAPRYTSFYATVEGQEAETKVYADENMKVLWNADDRITVFNQLTYNSQFRFTGDDGDNAGDFELIPPAELATGNNLDNIYAVYPYSTGNKITNNGNTITLSLPAEQQYKANSFGIGANTMIAVTDDNFLLFKNVGGYLSLRLYGDNVSVSRITIQGNNHEKIAGKADISVGVGVLPSVSMTEEATEIVSLVCDPAVKIGTSSEDYTEFWLVLPPTTFTEGFTLTVTDELGGVFQKTTSNPLTVSRSTIEWMTALEVVPTYDDVNIVFADANFKAYCVENFDTNGDGEVSRSEALTVTEIDVITDNIESLGGIEYFINLETLYCSGSETGSGILNELDLNSNTALKDLWCDFNQLTTLDVSNNTALTNLWCIQNQLTAIDVSNNTALKDLWCYDNQLTTLDVSNNSALTRLGCFNNQLTSLDMSNNTALTYLRCDNNQLTALDVSNNIALEQLSCEYNQLTSLDVSNDTALIWLNCDDNQLTALDVSNNIALIGLGCFNNQLTSLDVSNNTALTYLNCYNNQLTALDASNNTALTDLDCRYNQLTALDVSKNTALRQFSCSNNQLTALDVSNNTALTNLSCDHNQLTSLEVSNNTALTYLNCENNQLTALDVSNNTALTGLNCYNNQLTALDVSNNTALTRLDCYNNQLTALDVSNNTALTRLDCYNNQLTALDVSNNTALTVLRCSYNQLTTLDVSNNSALYWLNCRNNPSLTELWLKAGQTITTLYYDSSITTIKYRGVDDGVDDIVQFADSNFKAYCVENFDTNGDGEVSRTEALTVTKIDVVTDNIESLGGIEYFINLNTLDCKGSETGSGILSELDLSNNTALIYLDCYNNQLTALDVSNNIALTWLDCYNNQLTALEISNNTALKHLGCYNNQLTALDVSNNTALTALSCHINQLTALDVSNNTALTILSCYNNQLTALNVSNNTALKNLWCNNNQLTSLDVSKNTALTQLLCYNNPSLTELWLKTGQTITTLYYDSDITTIYYKD